MKSPSLPEGLVDDVFSPVARPSDGARRERPECDIPKSVGALHQSANALILTTDLFHAAASARPNPKHRFQDHGTCWSLSAPETCSSPPGHSEEVGMGTWGWG